MEVLLNNDLSKLNLLVIQIDGPHVAEDIVLIGAIGIDGRGAKHVLGLVEGATENAAATQALLDNLDERGLDRAAPCLFILDGAMALSKAPGRRSVGTRRSSAARFTRRAILLSAARRGTWPACGRRCAKPG